MRNSVKLSLTAVVAAFVLAAGIGSASARNFSVSNSHIRATWATFELEALITVRCPVTLEGTLHTSSIAKVERSLIGYITRAIANQGACMGGIIAPFNGVEPYNAMFTTNSLPWHITYERFTGTLPVISSISLLLRGMHFGIRDSSNFCTAQYGTATDNVTLQATREGTGAISEVRFVEGRNSLSLLEQDGGSIECPRAVSVRGRGSLMLLGTTTRITLTLI